MFQQDPQPQDTPVPQDPQVTPGTTDGQNNPVTPDTTDGQNSTVYNAVCESAHGLQGQWMGPNRSDSATAQADADNHNSNNPGHEATVVTNI